MTKSLIDALRNLRHSSKERTIWIDGICINQSTDALTERAAQVESMDDIFSNACAVIAHLGDKTEDGIRRLRLLLWLSTLKDHSKELKLQLNLVLRDITPFFRHPLWNRV